MFWLLPFIVNWKWKESINNQSKGFNPLSFTSYSSGSIHYDTHIRSLAKGVRLFWNTGVDFELSDINSSDFASVESLLALKAEILFHDSWANFDRWPHEMGKSSGTSE